MKEEILDIINKNDEVIGTATREECHNNSKLMHRTVHFTLVNRSTGEILITRRSVKKTHDGGKIAFLGEHLLSGESYFVALKRGIKEELGYNISDGLELAHKIFSYDNQTELVRFFVGFCNEDNLVFDHDEIENIWWIKLKELKSLSNEVSSMTKYWIDNVKWKDV